MSSTAQKLLAGSGLRTVALLASGGVAFLLLPFLVHHLGDRQYGLWALVGTFVGYYGMLDLGLTSSVCQYISTAIGREDWVECNRVFNSALRIHSLLGGAVLLLTLLCAFLAPVFTHSAQDASLFWKVIVLLGLSMAVSFPIRSYVGLLYAALHFDLVAWVNLVTLALRTAAIVWAVDLGYGLLGLAAATAASGIFSSIAIVWIVHRKFSWIHVRAASLDRATTKSLFSYSFYLFMVDIADQLRFQLDPVIITAFIGLAAVTHYRIASVLTDYYMRIMISTVTVVQPLFSRLYGAGELTRIRESFLFATKISVCLASFLCFALIAWGRPLILRWMGPGYIDAYSPLVVLALAMLMDLWQVPAGNFLNAIFKHRSFAVLTLGEGILNLAVSLALVRRYGILGVALGTLVAAVLVRIIAQPWWLCKVGGIPYTKYVSHVSRNVLVCACVICLCFVAAVWGLRPSYPYLFCSALGATLTYAIGSWFFIFGPDERRTFRAALAKHHIPVSKTVPSIS